MKDKIKYVVSEGFNFIILARLYNLPSSWHSTTCIIATANFIFSTNNRIQNKNPPATAGI